eukprot:g35499.t1
MAQVQALKTCREMWAVLQTSILGQAIVLDLEKNAARRLSFAKALAPTKSPLAELSIRQQPRATKVRLRCNIAHSGLFFLHLHENGATFDKGAGKKGQHCVVFTVGHVCLRNLPAFRSTSALWPHRTKEKAGADIYEVSLDRVRGSLSVRCLEEVVEDLDAATRDARQSLAHEIAMRKADIAGLEQEAATLTNEIRRSKGEGVDVLSKQLCNVNVMIGKHQDTVAELEARSEVQVKVKVKRASTCWAAGQNRLARVWPQWKGAVLGGFFYVVGGRDGSKYIRTVESKRCRCAVVACNGYLALRPQTEQCWMDKSMLWEDKIPLVVNHCPRWSGTIPQAIAGSWWRRYPQDVVIMQLSWQRDVLCRL